MTKSWRRRVKRDVPDDLLVVNHVFDSVDLHGEVEVRRRNMDAYTKDIVRVVAWNTETAGVRLNIV